MDANKLKVLQALPYRIQPVCGLCKYGSFPSDDWGSCEAHKYNHLKHSEATRDISIHKYGTCKNFEPAPERTGRLGHFLEFLDNENPRR
jgi:hypothetical protein